MSNEPISERRQQQLIEMMEVMEDTVEYFCDHHMVSGEVSWTMVASLADAKLGQFDHE